MAHFGTSKRLKLYRSELAEHFRVAERIARKIIYDGSPHWNELLLGVVLGSLDFRRCERSLITGMISLSTHNARSLYRGFWLLPGRRVIGSDLAAQGSPLAAFCACYVPVHVPAASLDRLKMVADRLVAAFRRVPTCPVMSTAQGFSMGGACALCPSNGRNASSQVAATARMLMTWARCRATGERMAPICREFQWNADQVDERLQRVALAAIVRGSQHPGSLVAQA